MAIWALEASYLFNNALFGEWLVRYATENGALWRTVVDKQNMGMSLVVEFWG